MVFAAVILPILAGGLIPLIKWKSGRIRNIYNECIVLATTAIVWYLILVPGAERFTLVRFQGDLNISFCVDGLSMIFAGLVSLLWPLATLYAFEYMDHSTAYGHTHNGKLSPRDEMPNIFFMFYTMTYGVTLGIALAANILTMYCFYEMLTLVTVPLVMHTLTRSAILASRKYMYYSLGGAAFAFLGMIFVITYGTTIDFKLGGVLDMNAVADKTGVLLLIYVFAFMGFSVKAAVCPFNSWLPDAGVAPTPVTALLHAVAVVKSGAFAIIRLTFYLFGTEFLRGTWAQYVTMAIVIITIIYGSARAVKEPHIKRRLAYSTISNLSYIVFGVTLMTPLGMAAALSHMIMHAVMKICSFFCAGAIMHKTGREYVYELDGLGYKMPQVFGIFTISAFALMGVPGLAGFVSKWNLVSAALELGTPLAYAGVVALLISAILTAIYMLTVSVRAFFPKADYNTRVNEGIKDPGLKMLIPLYIFAIAMIVLGINSSLIMDFICKVAAI
ncbi:MAG: proton-conducting membrane transporter [Lachnospiraceae bacterium]|nr:proton-conducting membrane transporter [Lachnospiraceae bacterium]